jgi:hypothetical protein
LTCTNFVLPPEFTWRPKTDQQWAENEIGKALQVYRPFSYMPVPPEIDSLVERLNQELGQSEQLAINGINLVKLILSRFPDNARMIELFAVLTNVLLFVEITRRRIQFTVDTISSSNLSLETIQEVGEDLSEMLGRVLENKMLTNRTVAILEDLK